MGEKASMRMLREASRGLMENAVNFEVGISL